MAAPERVCKSCGRAVVVTAQAEYGFKRYCSRKCYLDWRTAQGRPIRKPGRPGGKSDPTTCDRIYADDELAWLRAVTKYQQDTGDRSQAPAVVLALAKALGYRRTAAPTSL